MTIESTVRRANWLRGWMLPALMAMSTSVVLPASAGSGVEGPTRTAARLEAPLPVTGEANETLVMVYRRGSLGEAQARQGVQEMPQELPLLCLVMQVDEESLQMGPARFQELLDKAASSGSMVVLVLPPQ